MAVLGVAPLRALGRISYGVYLWHWPIIVWMSPERTHLDGPALLVARTAMTLGVALLSYHLLEMPIRRGVARGAWGAVLAPVAVALTVVAVVASTAGAVPPPSYLGGRGGLSFVEPCPEATARERAEATAVGRTAGRVGAAPVAGPRRVLVVGDSIACSLVVGLEQAAPPSTQVGNGAVIACGVVAGEVESTVWGRPRGQRRCPRYVRDTERRAQASLGGRADAVLWLSTWERFDLVSGSSVLRAGTKAWESALRHRYDRAIARFRRAGARVYLVLPAPSTNGSFGGHAVRTTRAADITMMRLHEFLQPKNIWMSLEG